MSCVREIKGLQRMRRAEGERREKRQKRPADNTTEIEYALLDRRKASS
jgi:hypothetical protein